MKATISIGFSAMLAALIISCRPGGENSHIDDKGNAIETTARAYLHPMLHIGVSPTNLIEQFGLPFDQYETKTHEVSMDFFFSDTNRQALAAGVGGFTAFFYSNQLTRWDPIYKR